MTYCKNRKPPRNLAAFPTCQLVGTTCGIFSGVGRCLYEKTIRRQETVSEGFSNGFTPSERAEFRAAVEKMLD